MNLRQRVNSKLWCAFWGCKPATGIESQDMSFGEQLDADADGTIRLHVTKIRHCERCGDPI